MIFTASETVYIESPSDVGGRMISSLEPIDAVSVMDLATGAFVGASLVVWTSTKDGNADGSFRGAPGSTSGTVLTGAFVGSVQRF